MVSVMLRKVGGLLLAGLMAACTSGTSTDVAGRLAPLPGDLPPMKTFASPRVQAPVRSNTALARDFLELSFEMESGRHLERLTRFTEPVTVGVRGPAPASLKGDLNRLIARLRREAGIDIRTVRAGEEPSIVVEVLSRQELQRVVPQAACFVVPNVRSWDQFRRERRTRSVDWTALSRRTAAAVFLPGDVSPQESRDCLHEEIAQALGPLNDLYRLPDSVFNDDNFHTVLTGFDMLMLRAYYDPALKNGMTRREAAARLPGILARINPRGQRGTGGVAERSPAAWENAIETALGPRTAPAQRRVAAKKAVEIAAARGWTGPRRAFSLYALGRLSLGHEPELALASFLDAQAIYRANPDTKVQAAHVAMQLAAFSLSAGQAKNTVQLVDQNLPAVSAAENAALLATLLMLKAEALEYQGQVAQARAVRLDSLGWARYGFGHDKVVRARVSEIAALAPDPKRVQAR